MLAALYLLCMALGGVFGDPLNGGLFDLAAGYRPLFLLMAGYTALAFGAVLLVPRGTGEADTGPDATRVRLKPDTTTATPTVRLKPDTTRTTPTTHDVVSGFSRTRSLYRPSSLVVASPKRSSFTPIRSISDRWRLQTLRFSSPLSR